MPVATDSAAHRAERIALAVIMGDVPATSDAFADLRLANREKDVAADVVAVRTLQYDAPVWTWPRSAPWAGFGAR